MDLCEPLSVEGSEPVRADVSALEADAVQPLEELQIAADLLGDRTEPKEGSYLQLSVPRAVRETRPGERTFWMTKQFVRDVTTAGRKLQARILQALVEPVNARQGWVAGGRGDSVKRLSPSRENIYRYRIGNHRMVFSYDDAENRLVLLAFASRGSVYEA
jgi:mRNA-degrading endonuclease RelE of RelBE toxin-antitoxin system